MSMTTEQIKQLRDYANIADIYDSTDMKMCAKAMREAADTIKLQSEKLHAANMERSSAYYHGGWIPVSERLPEKNMECLVSVGELYFTQIAIYSDLMGTIDHRIFYQGDYGHRNFENITKYVKAWMPLPKPYKAEQVQGR